VSGSCAAARAATAWPASLARKRAAILHNPTFDASELRVGNPSLEFDLTFSHAVLSQASEPQLRQYWRPPGAVMRVGALSLASIKFLDANWTTVAPTHNPYWVPDGASYFDPVAAITTARKRRG
jgi:hypothetical protein